MIKVNLKDPKNWKKIKNFDDIIEKESRKEIIELEKEAKLQGIELCKFLRKKGRFFYYCGNGFEGKIDETPKPYNPVCRRHVPLGYLTIQCFKNKNKGCYYYQELKILRIF